MTPYSLITNFLNRMQVLHLGRFMLRLHDIQCADETPFLHNHPDSYVSLTLRGGYTERVLQPDGTLRTSTSRLRVRRAETFHRIDAARPGTLTLFFAWRPKRAPENQGWSLRRHPDVTPPPNYWDAPDGLYWNGELHRKRHDGMWMAARKTATDAQFSNRLSIRQALTPAEWRYRGICCDICETDEQCQRHYAEMRADYEAWASMVTPPPGWRVLAFGEKIPQKHRAYDPHTGWLSPRWCHSTMTPFLGARRSGTDRLYATPESPTP